MIQSHKRPQRKPSRKNRQNRTRPIAMEQLEDRRVLATFGVNTLLDILPGDAGFVEGTTTSLRSAVMEANALGGPHTITLGPGTYNLTRTGNNEDLGATGDLDITSDLVIQGIDKNTTIIDGYVPDNDGRVSDRHFDVLVGGSLTLTDLKATNGSQIHSVGGSIRSEGNVSIIDSILSNNEAEAGGGAIHMEYSSTSILNVVRSTIESSQSLGFGGGAIRSYNLSTNIIDSQFIGNTGYAGAIHNSGGNVTVSGSLFQGNHGTSSGGAIYGFVGLDITNSTFVDNHADYLGGAIYFSQGVMTLTNVTIVNNDAGSYGGGVYLAGAQASLQNSIIALNSADASTSYQDLRGSNYQSLGGNIIGSLSGAKWHTTDIIGDRYSPVDPLTAALADNGGPTPTMALLPNSPAIDAGLTTDAPAVDQRGVARPQGLGIDIGAFEHVPNPNPDPNANAPTATGSSETTLEDTPLTGQMIGSDIDGDTLYFSVVDLPRKGKLIWSNDGSYTYTPNSNYDENDSFTFQVFTFDGASELATVNIDVTPVNDAPKAHPATFDTDEDTAVSGILSGHDDDGDDLTYLLRADAFHGTATVNTDGTFSYVPDDHWHGRDLFTFMVNDGTVNSGKIIVYIDVAPVNDAPVTGIMTYNTDEGTPFSNHLMASDVDDPNQEFIFTMVTAPTEGKISNFDPNTGNFTYTPNDENFFGEDTFTFMANDGELDSNTGTATIIIKSVNDTPVAEDIIELFTEDTLLNGQMIGSDADGESLVFEVVEFPSHGQLLDWSTDDGSYTYLPNLNYHHTDQFTYKVIANGEASESATVSIYIYPVNDAPYTVDYEYPTLEGTSVSSRLLVRDPDNSFSDISTFIESYPKFGTISYFDSSSGDFTYTPNDSNYYGEDSFTFSGTDGELNSDIGTATIVIKNINDAPELVDAVFALDENSVFGTVVGTVTGSDIDNTAGELAYAIVGGSGEFAFDINENTGEISVENAALLDYEANSSLDITVQVTDPGELSDTAQVTINLNDLFWVDIDIIPGDDTNTTKPDGSIRVAILSNPEFDAVNDLDAASLTFGKTGDEESLKLHKKHGTPQVTYSDVNGDGLLDAVVTFDMRLTGLVLGDTTATLRGTLLSSGEEFEVTDSILISEGKSGGGGGGNNGGGKGGGKKNR